MKTYKAKIMRADDQPARIELEEEIEIESTVAKVQELCNQIETDDEGTTYDHE